MSGLEAILLLGSLHGVVLATVLWRRERNHRANRYLTALLAALALMLIDGALHARGFYASHPHAIGVVAWLPFVVGPLVYLYVREMTAQGPTPPPWRHFVVTAADIVLLAIVFFPKSAAYKLHIASELDLPWFATMLEAIVLVYGMAYTAAALVLLQRHGANVRAIYSNLGGVSLRWLMVLVALNALVWLTALAAFTIEVTGIADVAAVDALVPLGTTATIFVIGYFQLQQAPIFSPLDVAAPPRAPSAPPVPPVEPAPAYQKARLADDDATTLEARIKAAMAADKLYQRAGLTLAELADTVAATPHEVSQVLSTRLGKNFYTFVNEHRVEHVKTVLAASDRPVLDLAFEAGFQSKSTFNAAFRKATGVTPSEYRTGLASRDH